MTEAEKKRIRGQARFRGIFDGQDGRFRRGIPFSSIAAYEECKEYIARALESGLDGSQVRRLEEELAGYTGMGYAAAVSSGTEAMRLALKLAAEKRRMPLQGRKVFCPDLADMETAAPIVLEGGEPVFIDSSDEDWSIDPEVLELAFEKYPDTGIVVMNHVYGFPGQTEKIRRICDAHGAVLIECAGEALGAEAGVSGNGTGAGGGERAGRRGNDALDGAGGGFLGENAPAESSPVGSPFGESSAGKSSFVERPAVGSAFGESPFGESPFGESPFGAWKKAGSFGDYVVLGFSRNTIIGGNGGILLARNSREAEGAAYRARGARESAPWNRHGGIGYGCAMGDPDAALIRGQLLHLGEIIEKKKEIYERYLESLDGDLAYLIPVMEGTRPNYWVAAMTVEGSIRFRETRDGSRCSYEDIHGTAAPMEIYDALEAFGAEAGPVYRPMSMQPVFRGREYFTLDGPQRAGEGGIAAPRPENRAAKPCPEGGPARNAPAKGSAAWQCMESAAGQYYESGICLPGSAGMTEEEQDKIIEIVRACYDRAEFDRAAWA